MRSAKGGFGVLLGGMLLAVLCGPASAATITIVNLDGAMEGFNDPTPVAPVGGNPGVTLGQQRLNVVQRAADIWGSILPSPVTIRVRASFDPIAGCTATSGVLGSAGPHTLAENFGGTPGTVPDTWYHIAEANKLAGFDLDLPNDDIDSQFNSDVDNAVCLGTANFYYGYDDNEGTNIDLLPVVLHELGHGLGFSVQTTLSTGVFPGNPPAPTIFSRFMLDNTTGLHWDAMTNGQRAASAVNYGNVVWDGAGTTAQIPAIMGSKHPPALIVNAPATIAGTYTVGTAVFGPLPSSPGVTAPVVLANDGVGPDPNDACEPIQTALAGKIALINRRQGACTFAVKAANAQAREAVGVIIVNDVAGSPPPTMGATNPPTITIPVVSVTQADGNTLKSQLANGLNCTIGLDPVRLAGRDLAGKLRLFAPNPLQSGSSISHWDSDADPNLLMEPALSSDLIGWVDITRQQMRDIGWFLGTTITGVSDQGPVAVRLRSAPNPFANSTAVYFQLGKAGVAELDVFTVDGRHVRRLVAADLAAGAHSIQWNGLDDQGRKAAAGVYLFKLRTDDFTATGRTVRLD